MLRKRQGLNIVLILILLGLVTIFPSLTLAQQRKLVLFTALGEPEWKVMREFVFPPFEMAFRCKIEAYQVESLDAIKKLEALHRAGKMEVDIVCQDNMLLAPLVEKGIMEDLTPYKDRIPKEAISALIPVGEFEGRLYFFPYRPNVEITYYNEMKFKKYGLKPPQNWDELLTVAKTFYDKEGIGRVAIKATLDANTTCHLFDFIKSAGGDPLKLNDEGCVSTFQFLQKLWPYLSPDSKRADWNTMNTFIAMESVYLGQNWPFGVQVIVEEGGKKEVKAYSGWRGPLRESHVLGGEVIGIPKGALNKELALRYIEYVMSREVQTILVGKLAWPSIRTDAYVEVTDWQKPYFAAVMEALKYAEPRPNVPYWSDVDKILNDAFRETVMEKKPVKETLDRYALELEGRRKAYSK